MRCPRENRTFGLWPFAVCLSLCGWTRGRARARESGPRSADVNYKKYCTRRWAARVEGLQRTPFSSARALGMSAEGLAELGRATASTEKNRDDSFELRMETAQFEGIITVLIRKSCGSAKPYRQEKLRARALHDDNGRLGRGGPMMPPGCCSRFVWPTRSTSLLARAPI